jgi:hypothetical protein
MDVPIIAVVASVTGGAGLTVRRFLAYLDRRENRQLARHVFDRTQSTDALDGYSRLLTAQRGNGPPGEISGPGPGSLPGRTDWLKAVARWLRDRAGAALR